MVGTMTDMRHDEEVLALLAQSHKLPVDYEQGQVPFTSKACSSSAECVSPIGSFPYP